MRPVASDGVFRFDCLIKVIPRACVLILSKRVTGPVLGGSPAMLTRTRVGWVLAAGRRRGGCCNYYRWKEWRGWYAAGNEVPEANDEQRGAGLGERMSRVASVTVSSEVKEPGRRRWRCGKLRGLGSDGRGGQAKKQTGADTRSSRCVEFSRRRSRVRQQC